MPGSETLRRRTALAAAAALALVAGAAFFSGAASETRERWKRETGG